jgi:hypothetical protein
MPPRRLAGQLRSHAFDLSGKAVFVSSVDKEPRFRERSMIVPGDSECFEPERQVVLGCGRAAGRTLLAASHER